MIRESVSTITNRPIVIKSNTKRFYLPSGTPPPAAPAAIVQIATPAKVLEEFHRPRSIILDVRRDEEIVTSGFIRTNHDWMHSTCSKDDCPELNVAAENMIHDKQTPIVVHCATGKRAAKAVEVLKSKGYKDVVNAGAYDDLDYLQQEALKEL